MILITIFEKQSRKPCYEITACQYCYDVRDKSISFRMNMHASTLCINCEEVSIEETEKGNIHILAYMNVEEIQEFESVL